MALRLRLCESVCVYVWPTSPVPLWSSLTRSSKCMDGWMVCVRMYVCMEKWIITGKYYTNIFPVQLTPSFHLYIRALYMFDAASTCVYKAPRFNIRMHYICLDAASTCMQVRMYVCKM